MILLIYDISLLSRDSGRNIKTTIGTHKETEIPENPKLKALSLQNFRSSRLTRSPNQPAP